MATAKRELSWKPYGQGRSGGRWFKKIDNRCKYFGTARTKSDRAAYRKAIASYRRFMRDRDKVQLRLERLEQKQQEYETTGRAPKYAAWAMAIDDANRRGEVARQQRVLAEARELTGKANGVEPRPSLADLITTFLSEQDRRHEISQSNPDSLPRKRRLSHAALRSIKSQLNPFKTWVEETGAELGSDSRATQNMLRTYRNYCDDLMVKRRLRAATVSNRVRGLRRFVDWLWQRRYIDELPRGLDEICSKYSQEKQAKALNDKEIQQLWKHADKRMRAIIALSLNCGFYFSEIAQLRGRNIRAGYVARRRPKTGVPSKHKLWEVTEKLIQQTRDNTHEDDLLYQTRQGRPLVHDDGTRTDSLHPPWRKLCTKAKVNATPSQLRDTAATLVERVGVREGNPKLVSQFLAHADGRTARWYIDQQIDPHDMTTDSLDEAIMEAETYFRSYLR